MEIPELNVLRRHEVHCADILLLRLLENIRFGSSLQQARLPVLPYETEIPRADPDDIEGIAVIELDFILHLIDYLNELLTRSSETVRTFTEYHRATVLQDKMA